MTHPYEAVVIGTSAGAVEALSALLPTLPADFPLPVLIVMHTPPDKKSVMPELMQAKCKVKVREAEDKEFLEPGTVYFAPPDYHLLVEDDRSISLSTEEPVLFSRPSIDVLFESASDVYGDKLIGVILTGANPDGANGLKILSAAGGLAIVQSPARAQAPYMPEAALKACPDAHILDLDQIGPFLQKGGSP
jgi:two-component system, chemotaxis family, protein-glutamate methylesterase/glutaminase